MNTVTVKSMDVTDPLDCALNRLSMLDFAVLGMCEACYIDKNIVEDLVYAIRGVQGEINEALERFVLYEKEREEKPGSSQSVQPSELGG